MLENKSQDAILLLDQLNWTDMAADVSSLVNSQEKHKGMNFSSVINSGRASTAQLCID